MFMYLRPSTTKSRIIVQRKFECRHRPNTTKSSYQQRRGGGRGAAWPWRPPAVAPRRWTRRCLAVAATCRRAEEVGEALPGHGGHLPSGQGGGRRAAWPWRPPAITPRRWARRQRGGRGADEVGEAPTRWARRRLAVLATRRRRRWWIPAPGCPSWRRVRASGDCGICTSIPPGRTSQSIFSGSATIAKMSTLPPLPTVLFGQSSDPEFNGTAARSGDLGLEAGATGERPASVSRWSAGRLSFRCFSSVRNTEGERRPIVHGVRNTEDIIRSIFFKQRLYVFLLKEPVLFFHKNR
jgi:hypothetical protein